MDAQRVPTCASFAASSKPPLTDSGDLHCHVSRVQIPKSALLPQFSVTPRFLRLAATLGVVGHGFDQCPSQEVRSRLRMY